LLIVVLIAIAAIAGWRWSGGFAMTDVTDQSYTNRLIHETSPYLLQHAHNPVDWYAWGEQAFGAAREQNKPIFLSIGYSTCYWCHVMERQVFENARIAEQMNEQFICIKVDREERPDVDEIYMAATQMMTQRGGWPMSVFLTPPGAKGREDRGLKPFYAGTYFPPEPQHGLPSFPQVLQSLSQAWKAQRGEVIEQAEQVAAAVAEHLRRGEQGGAADASTVQAAANQLLRTYDAVHGGFGQAPKFPTPNNLSFLLAVLRHNGQETLEKVVHHTLDRMAHGGMYDQVGGGFHRYSVDEKWLVPHFEKMLYDNGQLLEFYAAAYELNPRAADAGLYARVMRETSDYVLREMTAATGALFSAQDAEVNTFEGGNYIWTREQVEQAIGDERLAAVAVKMYGLEGGPNFRDPHHPQAQPANVLYLPRPLEDLAQEMGQTVETILTERQEINRRLKRVRDERDQPSTDEKVLTAWNGIMIGGLAAAGRVLREAKYVEAAGRAANAIVEHMTGPDGGLQRTMRDRQAKIPAFLEDYAFFVHGLIELARAQPGDARWLELAQHHTAIAIERFAGEDGGYYDTLADQSDLFVRTRSIYDGAIPSGNSQMIHNLLDLYAQTGDERYLQRAVKDSGSFAGSLQRYGSGMAHMQHAVLRALEVGPERLARGGATGQQAAEQGPVRVRVEPGRVDLSTRQGSVTVSVNIAAGYHINANTVADPRLIPTQVELVDGEGLALESSYPEPMTERFAFAEEAMEVFAGTFEITLHVSRIGPVRADAQPRLLLHYQACTESACDLPRTVQLPVELVGLH
jgi:hypothetical protein